MNALIEMLENIKTIKGNDCTKYDNRYRCVVAECRMKLKNYFEEESYSDEKLLNTMLFLYLHEDIDMYTTEQFREVAVYLHEEYNIYISKLLDMYIDFRKLCLKQNMITESNPNKISSKKVIIINGVGGAGKDTFCEIVSRYYKVKNISSIDPIKKIAEYGGWEWSDKSLSGRRLLSDLKLAFILYNDLPNRYLISAYEQFSHDDNEIMFVHIREPLEIKKFANSISGDCITLLVKSFRTDNVIFGNESDDKVEEFQYDYSYANNHSLENLENDVLTFFKKMIGKDKRW